MNAEGGAGHFLQRHAAPPIHQRVPQDRVIDRDDLKVSAWDT